MLIPVVYFLSRYDSYNPWSKATLCPLSEDVRRITVKEARALSASTSLIAADGTLVLSSPYLGRVDETFFLVPLERL